MRGAGARADVAISASCTSPSGQERETLSESGGEKESPVRTLAAVAVALTVAWATMAHAGEQRARPSRAMGAFVSAEIAGDVVNWQLDLVEKGGQKTYEMTVDVQAQYVEKDGVKEASSIRRTGGRSRPPREGTQVLAGKFVSAKLQGEKVLVTITPAEGENPAPVQVVLPKQLATYFRAGEEGKLTAYSIGIVRPPRGDAKKKK